MKTRFQVNAVVDTLAHAETIRTNLETQLAGKDIFERHSFEVSSEGGEISVHADFRFNLRADRDSVRDWIQDQLRDHPIVKTWILSVILSWHDCSHDSELVQDCKTTNYFEWKR